MFHRALSETVLYGMSARNCHAPNLRGGREGGREGGLNTYIPRQFFHCLGCAVLLCLVCLFDLACFFLSSFSSLI